LLLLGVIAAASFVACGDYGTPDDDEDAISAQAALTGTDVIVSRHVVGLNDQRNGVFGFHELTGAPDVDGNTGAYRGQLSPDGKVFLRRSPALTWELYPTNHLSTAVQTSGADVTGFDLDSALGQLTAVVDDNLGKSVTVPFTGNQLAVAFNPAYATKGIPVTDPSTCEIDTQPAFSPKDSAQYECLHLIVYARGNSELPAGNPTCSKSQFKGALCIMQASLVVALDRGPGLASAARPTINKAHLGLFRPIQMNGAAVRTIINEFAASGDGGLLFFVDLDMDAAGNATPADGVDIAYTTNPAPYLSYSASPYWASKGWSSASRLWNLYRDHVADPTVVRGVANGFGRAYPMAQYPFRFADGIPIRDGLGRYQWFSPEGSDMFLNIGSRAVAAVLGRETRGIVKQVDSPAQVTNTVYCSVCSPLDKNGNPNGLKDAPVCSPTCDPAESANLNQGNLACSHEPGCSNNGFPRFGVQEYTSFGSATGFWKTAEVDSSAPLLPFLRRGPSRYMLFNQKALAFFDQDQAGRGTRIWSFDQVSNDDFDDPHIVAAFHMNEAIFPSKRTLGNCDFAKSPAVFGCDIEVDFPFRNPESAGSFAADTSRNSALGGLLGGAQFPFDYWASKGVGERIQGNAQHTGEVNPGFRGRAVRFPSTGHLDVLTDARGTLGATKSALSVEVAVRPEANQPSYSGTLVAQPGVFELSLAAGKLTFTAGASIASAAAPVALTAGNWTHLAATVVPTSNNALSVTFYVDGVPVAAAAKLIALAQLPSAGAKKLCIGPGCVTSPAPSSTALWLDEVVVSDIARPAYYIAASANQNMTLAGFDAVKSSRVWPTYVGKLNVDYTVLPNGDLALKGKLAGLSASQLRVPDAVLTEIGGSQTKHAAMRALGRALFHDPILSTYAPALARGKACSSCHAEATGFTSPTHEPTDAALPSGVLTLNTPTIINRAFSIRQFLDVRADDVITQAVCHRPARSVEIGPQVEKFSAPLRSRSA
jgi:hypothetical protein